MTYSEAAGGPVVMGTGGFRVLATGNGQGDDPLARFSPHTAQFLRRQSSYGNVGDIVLNSLVDEDGHVAAFEELIGCHGGAGGLQTQPLLLYPTAWADRAPELVGSEGVHAFLSEHLGSQHPGDQHPGATTPNGGEVAATSAPAVNPA